MAALLAISPLSSVEDPQITAQGDGNTGAHTLTLYPETPKNQGRKIQRQHPHPPRQKTKMKLETS